MDTPQKIQNKCKKIALTTGSFLVLCLFLFANEVYLPHTNGANQKTVEIIPGIGSRKIADVLKKEGVIRSKWVFVTYVSLLGKASSLKPGIYTFESLPIQKITEILIENKKNGVTITIPEGWSKEDIAAYLEKEHIAQKGEFLGFLGVTKAEDYRNRFSFLTLAPKDIGLEGFLFPDTYQIYTTATPKEITEKMLENFDKKLDSDLKNDLTENAHTLLEVMTIASLIEKEVQSDDDRALVSGILWKRLSRGMPLQVDASIIYAKNLASGVKNEGNNNRLSLQDLKIDSPYNTYRHTGLPPSPIANPGLSAIRAAIYPKESSYLYYLSAPDGKTIFSETLEEHNEARAKYLTK